MTDLPERVEALAKIGDDPVRHLRYYRHCQHNEGRSMTTEDILSNYDMPVETLLRDIFSNFATDLH